MTKYIALYLPQYHPIPENDKWYGPGFTEWTNVAKAKPLFPGHYEPHIPADLGFYDLRLDDVRRNQAKLAQEYGITAFCYWYYWFGNSEQLLTMPIWEVYKDKQITLPFCLAWGNHSWQKKLWDRKGSGDLIAEQKYLGEEDYTKFFYTVLPLFKDDRYFKVNGKLYFTIFEPTGNPEIKKFISLWRTLAKLEGLNDFYFVGKDSDCRKKDEIISYGFDAVYDDNVLNIHHHLSLAKKVLLYVSRKVFHIPTVFSYKNAIKFMITENSKKKDVIPVIAPNWDHSPRSGRNAILLHKCEPKYFYEVVKNAASAVSNKPEDEQLVIIKSWNEWGEGNHLEPDLKYGRGYLEALKRAVDEEKNDKK